MICRTCNNELDMTRDLPNIKCGDSQCMICYRKEKHSYY